MAETSPGDRRPQPQRTGAAASKTEEIEAQRDFWRFAALFACGILVVGAGLGVLGFLVTGGTSSKAPPVSAPAPLTSEPARPAEVVPAPAPVVQTPAPATRGAPSSPGIVLQFGDLDGACGDLADLPSYLCLLNRGSEPAAGGARKVVSEEVASITVQTQYRSGISVGVTGKEHYRLEFGPPKGKALLPGLYSGAMRWPNNEGPYPGMSLYLEGDSAQCDDGQFRILEFKQQRDGKVLRFVADFDCSDAIGRIAVTQQGKPPEAPIDMRLHVPERQERR